MNDIIRKDPKFKALRADEPRTGEYKLGGEEPTMSSNGDRVIGYADYAVAIVDETTSVTPHIAQRISAVRT